MLVPVGHVAYQPMGLDETNLLVQTSGQTSEFDKLRSNFGIDLSRSSNICSVSVQFNRFYCHKNKTTKR